MINETKNICNELKQNYDISILKKNKHMQQLFITYATLYINNQDKFKDYTKLNKHLLYLIYNFYNPKISDLFCVKYITGPGYIKKYKNAHTPHTPQTTIYLFGENKHENDLGCDTYKKKSIFITDYFLKLFQNTSKFIDLFIELPKIKNEEYKFTENMNTLYHLDYKLVRKLNNKYPVRIHSIDNRIMINKYSPALIPYLYLMLFYKNNNALLNIKEYFKNELEMLSNIQSKQDLINNIINMVNNNSLLIKELKKTTLNKKIIFKYLLENSINKNIKNTDIIILRNFFKHFLIAGSFLPGNLPDILLILNFINVIFMDIYTVSRMFKKFNISKNEHYPINAYNIIYFAGKYHTEVLIPLLESIGFKKTEDSLEKYFSCVDMSNIKQPLF
jgi:hypothetical protein